MELNDSALYVDIQEMLKTTPRNVYVEWDLVLHTEKGTDVTPLLVDGVDFLGDHTEQFTDALMVTTVIGQGTFQNVLYPSKNNLKATLIRRKSIYEAAAMTFDAVLVNTESMTLTQADPSTANIELMDANGMVTVAFQLIDPEVTKLLSQEVKGCPTQFTVESLIRSLMTSNIGIDASANPAVDRMDYRTGNYRGVVGIDMWPPTNKKVYKQTILPRRLPLTKLPGWLQNNKGIYSTGMGYYLKRGIWYIYPLYDVTRFDKSKATLTVANVPPNKMSGMENTWKQINDDVFIVATAEVKHQDFSDAQQRNSGNGVSFTRASALFDNPAPVSGNKVYRDQKLVMTEAISENRPEGKNNVRSSVQMATDNYCLELSRLAQGQGSVVEFIWEHSNHDLIYPGMPCKFLYMHGQTVKTLMGTVIGLDTSYKRPRKEMTDKRHISVSSVRVWLTRDTIKEA